MRAAARGGTAAAALASAAGVLLDASLAFACPSCPTADRVRFLVLGDDFWSNVAIACVPFAVVGAVSVLLHRMSFPAAPREAAQNAVEPGGSSHG